MTDFFPIAADTIGIFCFVLDDLGKSLKSPEQTSLPTKILAQTITLPYFVESARSVSMSQMRLGKLINWGGESAALKMK